MLLAPNVVVHDPETDLAKISSDRLRAHGWSKVVVQYFNRIQPRPEPAAVELKEDA